MKITVLYIGTSLLSPLKKAEAEINKLYSLGLRVAAHNCGAPLTAPEWQAAARDISESEIVFIIHVTDSDNANRITSALDAPGEKQTVIAFNCMPDLMRRTRMGRLDFGKLMSSPDSRERQSERASRNLLKRVGYWMAEQVKSRNARVNNRAHNGNGKHSHGNRRVVPEACKPAAFHTEIRAGHGKAEGREELSLPILLLSSAHAKKHPINAVVRD